MNDARLQPLISKLLAARKKHPEAFWNIDLSSLDTVDKVRVASDRLRKYGGASGFLIGSEIMKELQRITSGAE